MWLGSSHPRWSAENREDSALPAHRAQGPRQDQWGSARQEGEEGRGLPWKGLSSGFDTIRGCSSASPGDGFQNPHAQLCSSPLEPEPPSGGRSGPQQVCSKPQMQRF